jgi:lipopolysaccharide transport system ATP-binding protein
MKAVELLGVGKKYRRGDRLRFRRTTTWGLRDISYSVAPGETIGIVGRNGAGKSTLLRLVAGVTEPTVGEVIRRGSVASILSLGDAFHPLLTGRENALTTAMIAGQSLHQAQDLMPVVDDFAGLGQAFEDPVRTYSSGMFLRLAFSVAVHVDADILVIDEVLAVGDLSFSSKCLDLLEQHQSRATTILLASHDLGQVRRLCDRAIWLEGGAIVARGSPEEVTGSYARAVHSVRKHPDQNGTEASTEGRQMNIGAVHLSTRDGPLDRPLPSGWPLRIGIAWYQERPATLSASFGVSLHNANGERCLDLVSPRLETDGVTAEGMVVLEMDRLDLVAGHYHVDVGVYDPEWSETFDYRWQHQWLEVIGNGSRGPMAPPHRWRSE